MLWTSQVVEPDDALRVSEKKEVKYLAATNLKHLYSMYTEENSEVEPASFTTFRRMFHEWSYCLKLRQPGQHSTCGRCAFLACTRANAETEVEKQAALHELADHLRVMYGDRREYAKMEQYCRMSVKGSVPSSSSVLLLTLDGMDQAKFRCPRSNLFGNKHLDDLFRPQLRCVCGLVPGVMEYYCLLESDITHDSSTQVAI